MMNKKLLISLPLALLLIWGLYIIISPTGSATISSLGLEITPAGEELAEIEKEALKEWVPEGAPTPGDTKDLKSYLEKKHGLKLRALRSNPDGTYSVVLEGGDEVRIAKSGGFSNEERTQYQKEFLSVANDGKKVELSERDQEEIQKFRRGVSGL